MKTTNFKVSVKRIIKGTPSNTADVFQLNEESELQFIIDLNAEEANPAIEIRLASEKEVVEFSQRSKNTAVTGYQLTINGDPVYSFYILSDGTLAAEDLFKQLVDLAGESVSANAFMRGSLKKFQQFAHALRQNLTTYKNFYGELSEDQKQWMRDNTLSYEEDAQAAKDRAKAKGAAKDGN